MWSWIRQAGRGLVNFWVVNISFSQAATECIGLITTDYSDVDKFQGSKPSSKAMRKDVLFLTILQVCESYWMIRCECIINR